MHHIVIALAFLASVIAPASVAACADKNDDDI
jgi:hypothetical protein